MIEIKAPNKVPANSNTKIFLAGSIDMGTAEKWQDKFVRAMVDKQVTLLNPRRDDWDNSWTQEMENPQFFEQVSWEQKNIESADIVVVVFDPNSKSPITLMELGLVAGLFMNAYVCCPKGFYRKGNVDILCARYDIPVFTSLDELIKKIRKEV